MQFIKGYELRQINMESNCNHHTLEKEMDGQQFTGDYVCIYCGQASNNLDSFK